MKLFLLSILIFLILTKIVFSIILEVNIDEEVKGKIIYETQNVSKNVVNFKSEFNNIGSVAYKARARVFVYNDSKLVFSGWSNEEILMPGDKKTFNIYFYSYPGNYESKLRFYFGNEFIEGNKTNFEINETLEPEDIFEIKNFRTYDNYVVFDILSKKSVNNVLIIPYKYPVSWIFEQKKLEKIDYFKTVSLNYYPSIWKPTSLTIAIVAEDGKYFSEKTIEMKKEEGIFKIFYNILDSLKLIL